MVVSKMHTKFCFQETHIHINREKYEDEGLSISFYMMIVLENTDFLNEVTDYM